MNKYRIYVEVEAKDEEHAWEQALFVLNDYSLHDDMRRTFSIECEPENNIGVCAHCGSKTRVSYSDPFHDEEGNICYDMVCLDCNKVSVEEYEPRYLRTVKGEEEDEL